MHHRLGLYCKLQTLQSYICMQRQNICLEIGGRSSAGPHVSLALLQNGVVHRDLKLENILLDQDLNVKVR